MRIASIQIAASPLKQENLNKALDYIGKAKKAGADMILFPEMFMFRKPEDAALADLAEPLDGPFVSALKKAAAEQGLYVVCGVYEQDAASNERVYNTVVVISDKGDIAAVHRKTHLCDAWDVVESTDFIPGDQAFEVIETEFGRIGLVICYELRFPEVTRLQAVSGMDILLVPAAWYGGTLKEAHWETLLKARAIENTMFVAASNQNGDLFCGNSMIIDPMGVTLARAGEEEGMILADIDLSRIDRVKKKVPCMANRVPHLY